MNTTLHNTGTRHDTAPLPQAALFAQMLYALHLASRELSEFYTPRQSQALRLVNAAIAASTGRAP